MKKYVPYGFDLKFEIRTYKNIGKDKKMKFKSKERLFYAIYYSIRNFCNRDEKKYKNFDNFSEWKEYIEMKVKETEYNKEDFKHYLNAIKNENEDSSNMIGSIATPIYICIITIGMTIFASIKSYILHMLVFIFMSGILLFAFLSLLIQYKRIRSKYYFCEDVINVLNK